MAPPPLFSVRYRHAVKIETRALGLDFRLPFTIHGCIAGTLGVLLPLGEVLPSWHSHPQLFGR